MWNLFKKKQKSVEIGNRSFGETSNSERYQYFGGDVQWERGEEKIYYTGCDSKYNKRENKVDEYVFYQGQFYYIKWFYSKKYDEYGRNLKVNYLWKSNEDGTNRSIIMEIENSIICRIICINRFGIYLETEGKIRLFDFDGTLKSCLETEESIKSCYVCDNRIMLITKNEEKQIDTAWWYDVTTSESHHIYTGFSENGASFKEEGNGLRSELLYIMGNNQQIVFYMKHIDYYPQENMEEWYDSIWEGWYSYSFDRKQIICLNNTQILPDDLLEYSNSLKVANLENKYGEAIVYFNMEKNLMWTIRKIENKNDSECFLWEPRNIGRIDEERVITKLPSWKITDDNRRQICSNNNYFDGEYRFCTRGLRNFFSYKSDGTCSEEWRQNSFSDDRFFVSGNYVFCIGEGYGYEYQYKLTHEAFPLRKNWMLSIGYGALRENVELEEIERFKNRGTAANDSMTWEEIDELIKAEKEVAEINDKLSYWQEFVDYAFDSSKHSEFKNANFSKAEAKDQSWYALRFGNAKVRIELTVSTKFNRLRTALFIKDEVLWAKLEQSLNSFSEFEIERKAKTPSLNVYKPITDFRTREEQFEWFIKYACILKEMFMDSLGK